MWGIKTLLSKIGGMVKGEKISDSVGAVDKLFTGKGTTRLNADNNAESWLTQSIRPLIALWVLSLSTYVLLVPNVALSVQTIVLALLSDIISFYFIARTTEKVIKEVIKKFGKSA